MSSSESLAFTREVPGSIVRCELTHVAREPIDVDRARAQHRAYERALEALGCEVVRLPPAPELPDSVFVEDAAVVIDGTGIVTRPGAASRRTEVDAVEAALRPILRLRAIEGPDTLDGGDVLRAGRFVFVGTGGRSTPGAVDQLRRFLGPVGFEVMGLPMEGCLHLKTAVTRVDEGVLLVNPAWVDPRAFAGFALVDVDPGEPFAANALRVGGAVLHAAAHSRTRARLEARGIRVVPVDVSELAKAEAGVTCCSIVVPRPAP